MKIREAEIGKKLRIAVGRKMKKSERKKMGGNVMSQLPQDPMIHLSYVNTQLRDHYGSLEEFCAAEDADQAELEKKLRDVDFEYDPERNAFV